MEKFWMSIFTLSNRIERQHLTNQLTRIYIISKRGDEKVLKKFKEFLKNPSIDKVNTFQEDLDTYDRKTISLAEMQQLDQLAASGKAFVMPVSFNDGRLMSHRHWSVPK